MRHYCENCVNWNIDVFLRFSNKDSIDGCTVVIDTDEEHPIAPRHTYLSYAEANKNGDCEHYKDKGEGLGMASGENRIVFAEESDEVDET